MRTIDADALMQEVISQGKSAKEQGFVSVYNGLAIACGEIINAPTIEAEPVRHGHWVKIDLRPRNLFYYCDLCRSNAQAITKHCPNCGAKMDAAILTSEGE